MAAIYRRPRSKFWQCQYRAADGRWLKVSTKLTDRKKALVWCQALQEAEDRISRGSASEAQLREIISRTAEQVSGRPLASPSVKEWFGGWLAGKTGATSEATLVRYRQTARDFLEFLGPRSNARLENIDSGDVIGFRDHLHAQGKTPMTCNLAIGRILGAAFRAAFRQGYVRRDPVAGVPRLADRGRKRKQAFTLPQVQALVATAQGEWKGVIIAGFVTAMRLGDIVTLRWENIDLTEGLIHFRQGKTDAETVIALHEDLRIYLEGLQAERTGYIFPKLAARRIAGSHGLSNEFSTIMARAGITSDLIRERKGSGRNVHGLSFHSLRHSSASAVFRSKIVEQSVKAITGHGAGQAHKTYLHADIVALKSAVAMIPRLS
jgi:integrase